MAAKKRAALAASHTARRASAIVARRSRKASRRSTKGAGRAMKSMESRALCGPLRPAGRRKRDQHPQSAAPAATMKKDFTWTPDAARHEAVRARRGGSVTECPWECGRVCGGPPALQSSRGAHVGKNRRMAENVRFEALPPPMQAEVE